MSYQITITNSYKPEDYKEPYNISPTIYNLKSEGEYIEDDKRLDDGTIQIPLYKRSGYVAIPPNGILKISTDNVNEAIYYQNLNLDTTKVDVTPTDGSTLTVNLMDYKVDGVWSVVRSGARIIDDWLTVSCKKPIKIPENATGYIVTATASLPPPVFTYTTILLSSDKISDKGLYPLLGNGRKSNNTEVGTEITLKSDEPGNFLAIYLNDISEDWIESFTVTFTTD